MTDREIIIHLAKFMGWEIFPLDRAGYSEHAGPKLIENVEGNWIYFGAREIGGRGAAGAAAVLWNPLDNWQDVMEVQEKVLADPKLSMGYVFRMNDMARVGVIAITTPKIHRFLLSAVPRLRCLALVETTS